MTQQEDTVFDTLVDNTQLEAHTQFDPYEVPEPLAEKGQAYPEVVDGDDMDNNAMREFFIQHLDDDVVPR